MSKWSVANNCSPVHSEPSGINMRVLVNINGNKGLRMISLESMDEGMSEEAEEAI